MWCYLTSALRVVLRSSPDNKLREDAGSTKIVSSWLMCQALAQGQFVSLQASRNAACAAPTATLNKVEDNLWKKLVCVLLP